MKALIMCIALLLSWVFCRATAASEESGLAQVMELITAGKVTERSSQINLIKFRLNIRRIGDLGMWRFEVSELPFNGLAISRDRITLNAIFGDAISCPLLLVPAFPDLDGLLKIETEGGMFRILGMPFIGGRIGEIVDWGFFCIDHGEVRILRVRARVDRANGGAKLTAVEIGTGTLAIPP
jgi:hypothetical protein